MKFTMRIFFFIAMSLNVLATVEIIETDDYGLIFEKIDSLPASETLVVFDIDETLLVVEECKDSNPNTPSFIRFLKNVRACGSILTETNLPEEIVRIQKEGYPTMALTARGRELQKATHRELNRHEISFVDGSVVAAEDYEVALTPKKTVEMKDGVFFAGGRAKGKMMKLVLDRVENGYKNIVFIDDNNKNVRSLRNSFRKSKEIEMIVFEYTKFRH